MRGERSHRGVRMALQKRHLPKARRKSARAFGLNAIRHVRMSCTRLVLLRGSTSAARKL